MAVLAALFGAIGRQAGRVLTTALGWASTLLFGRVPRQKQLLLSLIALGSLAWVVLLLGTILPNVGTFLLTALPLSGSFDQNLVRLAMLIGALVVPLLIGLGGLFIVDVGTRPTGLAAARQVLRGYPIALLLAFTFIFLAIVALVRKGRTLARRRADAHIPIVVHPGGYEIMVDDLETALCEAGLTVERRPAAAILAVPGRLVARVAGGGVRALVPHQLTTLYSPVLEVELYPSDIAVSGQKEAVARARAAIATRLTATAAYLTTSKEAQAVEDRLDEIVRARGRTREDGRTRRSDRLIEELRATDTTLATLDVDYAEWEVLYRMRLQIERDLLVGSPVGQALHP
jgi:ABC-type multidrug transport system fused ATPase/permease subunit